MLIKKVTVRQPIRFIFCRSITFYRIAQCDREDQCQIVSGAMELLQIIRSKLKFRSFWIYMRNKLRFLPNGIKDRRPCLHSVYNVANNIWFKFHLSYMKVAFNINININIKRERQISIFNTKYVTRKSFVYITAVKYNIFPYYYKISYLE